MEQAVAVERTIWINAPREKAWQAVTRAEHLDLWYATCCRWEIPALQVGTMVKFFHKDSNSDTDILQATIEVINPLRQFTLRWQPDKTYPAMTLVTTFMLEEENGGTRVTIIESGYEALPDDLRQQWLDQTGVGYAGSMENLQAYLEGRSLPH